MKTIICFFLSVIVINNINAEAKTNLLIRENNICMASKNATPLLVAISKGELKMVKTLIEYSADINEKSNDLTPLMAAVIYNHIDIVKFLISKGAVIEKQNESGNTALKFAIFNHQDEIVVLLKEALKK
jgi:ankyrin repeat protein